MAQQIIFYILAVIISVFSIMAVTSKRLIRSATYLLFVLLGTAGLYLLLGYHYLFAVQVAVYAGGIMVLYILPFYLRKSREKESRLNRCGNVRWRLFCLQSELFLRLYYFQ